MFPETAVVGALEPDVDPKSLVEQQIETFTMTLTGTGTAQAVDASPIEAIAAQRLEDAIAEGYELVDGSTTIDVGDGTVVNGVITFPVDGSAKQVRPLDAAALERSVLGLSKADAEAALAEYGEVAIVLWPGYVTSVPTIDGRVTVVVAPAVDEDAGGPTPSPRATAAPQATDPPDGSQDADSSPLEESASDAGSGEPLPSG